MVILVINTSEETEIAQLIMYKMSIRAENLMSHLMESHTFESHVDFSYHCWSNKFIIFQRVKFKWAQNVYQRSERDKQKMKHTHLCE